MREIVKGVVKTGKYMFIGDEVYIREATDRVKVKAYDLGAGQLEIVGSRVYEYRPVDELDFGHQPHPDYFIPKEPTPAELAEREERNRERAAKRARANVRRLSKVMGANALMTLTYRANVTDLAVCKKHLKEFVRRLYRVIPEFQGIAAFEQQERGAWHVHLAVRRVQKVISQRGVAVKSYKLLLSIWRSVVGDLGGAVHLRNTHKRTKQASAAQIASYISKYISKAFEEGAAFVNRWTKFGDCKVPKAMDFGQCGSEIVGFEVAFDLIAGDQVVRNMCRSRFGDFFFIVVEKPDKPAVH